MKLKIFPDLYEREFLFPNNPQKYDLYPFTPCNDLFEEASSSLFHTQWSTGCLSCLIFVEQCCRYEFHHIHSLDKFTPLRLEWHCDTAVMFFSPSFCTVLYWFQQEPTSETFIVASICWTGNEDEMGFCIHKCSVMLIRGEQNTDWHKRIVHSAPLVKEIFFQQSAK